FMAGESGTPRLDTEAGAALLCDFVQQTAARILQSDGDLSPRAWILARRSPLTGDVYPDEKYGLLVALMPDMRNERDIEELFGWIRETAARAAAIGVVFVTPARTVRLSESPRHDLEAESLAGLLESPRALYLSLEHRALASRRHRLAAITEE